jgi:GT2 family glycosyltransferase
VLNDLCATEADTRLAEVTILVVSYNSGGVLEACLRSIPPAARLVVVDNASSDGSAALAARLAPWAQVIHAPENLGFGRAANLGFAGAITRYGLLLNADTRCTPGMVEALLDGAGRYPEAGLLAPRIATPDGGLQFGHLPILERHRRRGTPMPPEGDCCAPYVGGAAMFFPLSAFRAIGGFDPNIFLYYEDDDICMRMRRAGRTLVHVHAARLEHGSGQSSAPSAKVSRGKEWHMGWSRQHMLRKYRGPAVAALQGGLLLAELAARLALRRGDPRRRKWAARLDGTLAALRGRSATATGIR